MRKKLCYCVGYRKRLLRYLEDKEIKFKIIGKKNDISRMISFYIYDDEPYKDDVKKLVWSKPVILLSFSPEELDEADYLRILPTKDVISLKDNENTIQYCGCYYESNKKIWFWQTACAYEKQIKPLVIYKFSSWGKAMFYCSDDGSDIIFTRNEFKKVVDESKLKGIFLKPVYVKKNNELVDSGLSQMTSTDIIPIDKILVDNKCIRKCVVCGKKKIVKIGSYQLKLDYNVGELDKDLYMTDPEFGSGITHPIYLISHNMYVLLRDKGMDKNMIFEPVIFNNKS